MVKEIAIGVLGAVSIFMLVMGYDITPLLVLGGLGLVLYYASERAGVGRVVVPGGGGPLTPEITFDDIGGQRTAKQELKEALDFIIRSDEVEKLRIRPLKGILLTGPPGTGKTLLAKAAAAYTDALFIAASGSEFIEMYAGVGAQRIRSLFRRARGLAQRLHKNRAVVFIDELEVVAGRRGTTTSHHEYDQTLNQLLVEMDGLHSYDRVRLLVIGATNRADMLDPALLRPGRFDRVVRVELPDKKERLEILSIHVRQKPLARDVDLEAVAGQTFGFSGAHLESVVNEAAILAFREGSGEICTRHLKEAVDKVMLGEKVDRTIKQEELYRIAVHECGHALVSEVVYPGSVAYVTIMPRGQALGYTRQAPQDDRYLLTRRDLEMQMMVLLGGALAEEAVCGSRSTGSGRDFEQALQLAKNIVFSGLSGLGIVDRELTPLRAVQQEVGLILRGVEAEVREILEEHREKLLLLAGELVREEYISGDRLCHLLREEGRERVS